MFHQSNVLAEDRGQGNTKEHSEAEYKGETLINGRNAGVGKTDRVVSPGSGYQVLVMNVAGTVQNS